MIVDSYTRYDHPEIFVAPIHWWQRKQETIINSCEWSISGYLLAVIGNLHNSIMASDKSRWAKIAVVILLDIACLAVCVIAAAETALRWFSALLATPLLILACCIHCPPLAISAHGYFSGIACLVQIPASLYTVYQITTYPRNVNPVATGEAIGSNVFPALTCGLIRF